MSADKEQRAENKTDEPLDADEDKYEMLIELPRDILTAYMLIHLSGRWDQISRRSRACVWFGVIFAYGMQWAVFFSFIGDLDFDNFSVGTTTSEDWWFNLVAIGALFMYLWKDVIAFYNSVWFWVGRVERDRNFRTFSKLKNFTSLRKIQSGLSRMKKKKDMARVFEEAAFWKYRCLLISVFVLYGGFGLYSLVSIGNNNQGLVDKMNVAIQVFFVLEIDDWACSLFILNPGVLDDNEFDVSIMLNETAQEAAKRIERRLLFTTIILVTSILSVYVLSNYKSYI
eukprot:287120_1